MKVSKDTDYRALVEFKDVFSIEELKTIFSKYFEDNYRMIAYRHNLSTGVVIIVIARRDNNKIDYEELKEKNDDIFQ